MNHADEDLEQSFVPPEEREAVRSFEYEPEAELAAGYLRANGIATEVGNLMIPGLPYDIQLWVHKRDAAEARRLLDAADAAARGPRLAE